MPWTKIFSLQKPKAQRFAAGSVINRQSDPIPGLFHVEHGLVRVVRHNVTMAEYGPNSSFGAESLFGDIFDEIIAVTDTQLKFWPRAAALLQLKAHPNLAIAFAGICARTTAQSQKLAHLRGLKSAQDRILYYLIQENAVDQALDMGPLTQMAAHLGLAQESLYRELKILEQQGLLMRPKPRVMALISKALASR